MTFSENITDSQIWVPSPKIMMFYQFRHSPAQIIVTFKQIRHEQHLNIMLSKTRKKLDFEDQNKPGRRNVQVKI
jgi:hypothetical protein